MNTQITTATPSWALAVPLLSASTGALIALCGVLITALLQNKNFKKQVKSAHALKVAEMRQAWIGNLRDAMCTFHSYGVTPMLDHATTREFYEYGTRIELLMNPEDQDYNELQNCLYVFLAAKTDIEKFSANAKYVNVCQRILKHEWDKLKDAIAIAES